MKLHPDPQWLAEWLGRWSEPEDRQRVLHLLQCAPCRRRAEAVLAGPDVPPGPARLLPWPTAQYERLIARVAARGQAAGVAITRAQVEAPVLLGELLLLPAVERRERAAADPRYASWWLAELAVARGDELAATEPGQAGEMLDLAGAVLDRLEPPEVPAELIADLRGRWWMARGELLRLAGDPSGAGEALAAARTALSAGSGDRLERAGLSERTAALRHSERRFGEAARLAGRAARLYTEVGDFAGLGRAALARARAFRAAGKPTPAAKALEQAMATLPAEKERRLWLEVAYELVDVELARGRALQAHRAFEAARPVSRQFTDPATVRRRVALAGRIELALGRYDSAEPLLAGAWRMFAEDEPGLEAVLLAVERARLLVRQGRGGEVAALAANLEGLGGQFPAPAAGSLAHLLRLLRQPPVPDAALEALATWCGQARLDPDFPPGGKTGGRLGSVQPLRPESD